MARRNLRTPIEEAINPFEINCDTVALMSNLNDIDNRSIRARFKNTQDPINLAFKSIENTSLKTLARDFVKEGFNDIISFITGIVNN